MSPTTAPAFVVVTWRPPGTPGMPVLIATSAIRSISPDRQGCRIEIADTVISCEQSFAALLEVLGAHVMTRPAPQT